MKDCPNCDNSGCIPEQVGDNEWEPCQCEFCYTVPDSIFNVVKDLQSTITQQAETIKALKEDAERLANNSCWASETLNVHWDWECAYCHNQAFLEGTGWECEHGDDCPITLHNDLINSLEGKHD